MTVRWRCERCGRCFHNRAWGARFAVRPSCPACDGGQVLRWGRRRSRKVRALAR